MIIRRNYFDHINGNVRTGASSTHGMIRNIHNFSWKTWMEEITSEMRA